MRCAIILIAVIPLLVTGCKSSQRQHEENEVEVTLDQVPAAVKDAFARESGGAPLGTIKREQEKGKTVYEANITKGAKTSEVEVDETGKVVKRSELRAK